MAEQPTELVYEGGVRGLAALVGALEAEGLVVRYDPPLERRGVAADTHTVVISIIGSTGTVVVTEGVRKAVKSFRERFPGGNVRGRHERPH